MNASTALRIAVVTETYPPEINGVALTLSRFVTGLLQRGQHVELVCPAQRESIARDSIEIVNVRGVALPRYSGLQLGLPAGRRLAQRWQKNPPDLVHIATEGPLGWSALNAARALGLPVVSGFHTNFHSYSRHYGFGFCSTLIARYLRWFHNRCAVTLAPTADLVESITTLGVRNAEALARGIDTAQFSPRWRDAALRRAWGVTDDTPIMLYVGRLAAEKNLDLALRAYQHARRDRPALRLVLVGDGPLGERLRARHPTLIFAGVQRGTALARHYASADIFLFPSLTETFGNVTLEALASGLAVIAYDYAAAHQHIAHGQSGLAIPPGDEIAFIDSANHLAKHPALIKQLGTAARESVLPYSWDSIIEQLLGVYWRTLNQKGARDAQRLQCAPNA